MTTIRYSTLPPLPAAGPLERYMDSLSVIVPYARTNLVLNPSIETNTTGYTVVGGASIARSTVEQYHGAYSLAVTPGAGTTDGVYYGTVPMTINNTYAVSCKLKGVAGVPYRLSVVSTGAQERTARTFIGTGQWQWIWLIWTETATNSRRIYIAKDGSANTGVFYIDGLQVELCGSEGNFVTTYIDGDQRGYLANQFPPAYLWNGIPHASTSTRSGQTRAGGRIVRWKDLGFLLTAIIGLGLAPPRNDALGFAQLDGAQWQQTTKPERSMSFVGRWVDGLPTGMQSGQSRLSRMVDRDRVGIRQPLALCLQAQYCNEDIGDPVTIQKAIYASGLEGNVEELPTGAGNVTFAQYLPYVVGRDGGAALSVQSTFTMAHIAQRSPAGAWSGISTGANAFVSCLAIGPDGSLYAGGNFTLMAGVANTAYIAKWDGTSWTALGTGANAAVNTIAFDAAGNLYAGGNFTLMGGVANTAYIARWNGSAWSALSTGMNSDVQEIAFDSAGNLYAGGSFTLASGVANTVRIARWNGSAWSALGTGASSGTVYSLAIDGQNNVYAGGSFASMGGVADTTRLAKWNGSAWSALGTGATGGSVFALAFDAGGILYLGGGFTGLNGLSISRIGQWNGTQFTALGTGVNNDVNTIGLMPNGTVYVGGVFTTAGGVPATAFAFWNGSAWTPGDISLPGSVNALAPARNGTLYLGGSISGATTASATATATNNGTAATSPILIINGPTSGTSVISQLTNVTTGATIYFNLTLSAGEVATLVLDPQNLSFTSSFRGNIYNTILPGSQPTQFVLQPGANTVAFFAASSTVTAVLRWETRYLSLNDALYQAVGDE